MARSAQLAVLLLALVGSSTAGRAADWPMGRGDAARSGSSTAELPEDLRLWWTRELPPPRPAWPEEPRLHFDRVHEVVAAAGRVFIASAANDTVMALDAGSGAEVWTFFASGPVRFAPVVWRQTVLVASDDGYLYSLSAVHGSVRWRVRGGPSDRRIIGNERLISTWPARGGPVVAEDTVYFAAGIWPFMGIFVHAVDAESGSILWTNDTAGSLYLKQPHDSSAFGGLAPQGYLAVHGDRLLVPNGRAAPAVLDRATGAIVHLDLDRNARKESWQMVAGHEAFINAGQVYRLADGEIIDDLGGGAVVASGTLLHTARFVATKPKKNPADRGRRGDRDAATLHRLELRRDELKRFPHPDPDEFRVTWPGPEATLRYRLEVERGRVRRLLVRDTKTDRQRALEVRSFDELKPYVDVDDRPHLAMAIAYRERRGQGGRRRSRWGGAPTYRTHIFLEEVDRSTEEGPPRGLRCVVETHPPRDQDPADTPDEEPMPPPPKVWRTIGELEALAELERAGRGDADAYLAARLPGLGCSIGVVRGSKRPVAVELARSDGAAPVPAAIRAGSKLFVGLPGQVVSVDAVSVAAPDSVDAAEEPLWQTSIDGTVGSLAAADGKLFVTTTAGRLLCYGGAAGADATLSGVRSTPPFHRRESLPFELSRQAASSERPSERPREPSNERLERLIDHLSIDSGYGVVAGVGSGRAVQSLLERTALHVIVVDPDARAIANLRSRLDRCGVYGTRVAAIAGRIDDQGLPPYLASLAVIVDPAAVGGGSDPEQLARVFALLRPYGGVACLPHLELDRARELARSARLEKAELERLEPVTLLRRRGALPGAGAWTHQHADAANTGVSADTLVRAPLGLLWFGGPSNEAMLPRHGHGPAPQVVGGRLFVEGTDVLRALDVYTGRLLWERSLPGIGAAFENEEHQPGANSIGSNHACAIDGVYVAYGDRGLRLDPATGATLAEFVFQPLPGTRRAPAWGTLAIAADRLLVGVTPQTYWDPNFDRSEFSGWKRRQLARLEEIVTDWCDFEIVDDIDDDDESSLEFALVNLNRLLAVRNISKHIPAKIRENADAEEVATIESEIANLPNVSPHDDVEEALLEANRKLLKLYYESLPALRSKKVGDSLVWDGTSSQRLVAIDRYDGEVAWWFEANDSIRHNAIVFGGGRVYAIDRKPEAAYDRARRRGRAEPGGRLVALDAVSGATVWSSSRDVFGTWLGYSAEHDILIQAGRPARDTLPDEPGNRLSAHRGADGRVLWDEDVRYSGPCLLHRDAVITQGQAFDLLTGQVRRVDNPLTGAPLDWKFTRNYGCATAVASEHLLTFRSAAAGFFDLAGFGGTGNLGGFRSSCTSNLIVADGVLCAPEYTRDCTCSYQNQASLALVHAPEAELWTFNSFGLDGERIERLGVNLGAPGDRRAADGTLWLEFPIVGGPSPRVDIENEPAKTHWFRFHPSRLESAEPPALEWVAASGARGLHRLTIALGDDEAKDEDGGNAENGAGSDDGHGNYTVRLHFAEPEDRLPGERVFDVRLQKVEVLENFDIVKVAGGPRRPVVREFVGVRVDRLLEIELRPSGAETGCEPVLCGVEILPGRP